MNGMLYSYKKESSNGTCYNTYEHCGNGKKKVTKGKISYDSISTASRIDKYTEMKSGCQD